MKKLLIALMMISIASTAFASETRIRSLGPNVAPFIADDSGVFLWYGTLPSYANLVTITAGYYDVVKWYDDSAEYDDDMTAKFGMTYGLGEDNKYGVLGMWWHEHTYGPNYMGAWWGPYPGGNPAAQYNIYNKWDVMWGNQFESFALGLYFNRADEGYYETMTDSEDGEYYSSYMTLGIGISFDTDEFDGNIAFDYQKVGYTYTDLGDEAKLEQDAGNIFEFRGNAYYEWTDVITWVPYLRYKWGDLSFQSSEDGYFASDDCWGVKGFQLDLAIAANMQVNEDNLIIVGIEPYGYYKGEPSDCGSDAGAEEYKMKIFPGFVFGFESDVKDWLTFRAGCDKALIKFEGSYEGDGMEATMKETAAPFEWYLGLGFHVGDFDIDAMLNKQTPFSMGYWLTGFQPSAYYDDAETPIGMISATYSF
jgi:hypothetical protein